MQELLKDLQNAYGQFFTLEVILLNKALFNPKHMFLRKLQHK